MGLKKRIAGIVRRWPIFVVAVSAILTVVWIGALIWIFVELLADFSGI
jgi:hypothetical protein